MSRSQKHKLSWSTSWSMKRAWLYKPRIRTVTQVCSKGITWSKSCRHPCPVELNDLNKKLVLSKRTYSVRTVKCCQLEVYLGKCKVEKHIFERANEPIELQATLGLPYVHFKTLHHPFNLWNQECTVSVSIEKPQKLCVNQTSHSYSCGEVYKGLVWKLNKKVAFQFLGSRHRMALRTRL